MVFEAWTESTLERSLNAVNSDDDLVTEYTSSEDTSEDDDEEEEEEEDTNENVVSKTNNDRAVFKPVCTLHRAIWKGKKMKILRYLSKKNKAAKINKQDKFGRSALHFAAVGGDLDIVQLLLSIKDINVNLRDNEMKTPFYKAAQFYSVACMRELHQHGASINIKDTKGHTPLEHIIINYNEGYMECAQYLIEEGESFIHLKCCNGKTLLHLAAIYGRVEICTLLLDNGLDVNEKDDMGDTPLILATKNKHTETAQLLLERSTDISLPNFGRLDQVQEGRSVRVDGNTSAVKYKNSSNLGRTMSKENEVKELRKVFEHFRDKRDEISLKVIEMKKRNALFLESVKGKISEENVVKDGKHKNIFHSIKKRSTRLLTKHTPKMLVKQNNENEHKEEIEKLMSKTEELQQRYIDLQEENDGVCTKIIDCQHKLDDVSNKNKELSVELETLRSKVKIEKENEKKEYNEVRILDKECQMMTEKSDEIRRKILSFESKSKMQKEGWEEEIKKLENEIEIKNTNLKEYEEGKLDKYRDIIEKQKKDISAHDQTEIQMIAKFEKLREKYFKLKERKRSLSHTKEI